MKKIADFGRRWKTLPISGDAGFDFRRNSVKCLDKKGGFCKYNTCNSLSAEADLIFITNMWNYIPLCGIIAWAMKAFSGWG